MQPVGFVLLCVGIIVILGAKRIVYGKMQLEDKDKEEFGMLATGGIIAVKVAGLILTLLGLLFLIL